MSLTKIGGAVSNPSVRADIEQLQSDRMLFVDSVADLAGIVGGEDGQQVSVKGYHTGSDVGGGVFYWDSTRTAENNGGTVFNGWVRVLNDTLTPEMFGAVGDGLTDDAVAIRATITTAKGEVRFREGTYCVRSKLLWRSGVRLVSEGVTTIKVGDGANVEVIGMSSASLTVGEALTNVGATGMIFDGNGANQSSAVAIRSAASLAPVNGAYFERCVFKNALGYGMAHQFSAATTTPDNNYVKNVVYNKCDFANNGQGNGVNQFDGIDVKNCDGITFYSCSAYDNALDGFDFRGDNVELHGCTAYNNNVGLAISANTNGNTQNTSVRVFGGHYHSNASHGVLIANNPAGGAGLTRVSMDGPSIRNNSGDGINMQNANANTYATVTAMIFANTGHGIRASNQCKSLLLDNCHCVDNGGSGVYANINRFVRITGGLFSGNARYGYEEGANATRNMLSGGQYTGNTLGSLLLNSASANTVVDPSLTDYLPNSSAEGGDILPSAATLLLPWGGQYFDVSGTANISDIAGKARGRVVTLKFMASAAGAGLVNGTALRLTGGVNFAYQLNSIITFVCLGTAWIEISRSSI
jgi:hypothetical protein